LNIFELIAAACSAALGIAAVMGLAYRLTIMPRLNRIEEGTKLALYHLVPNGHEDEAHPDDRDLPVRRLLHRLAREQRGTNERLGEGATWMRGHDLEHVRHDPSWPDRERSA
jgi:hypothetical protein